MRRLDSMSAMSTTRQRGETGRHGGEDVEHLPLHSRTEDEHHARR
jgi:hypothetical protein